MKTQGLAVRGLKIAALAAVLAFGLALAGCDKCGDFFWQRPGYCKAGPTPS